MITLMYASPKIKNVTQKTTYTLKEAQDFVGGYVEHIQLADGRHMLVDEEGKLKPKGRNPHATALLKGSSSSLDYIVGDALIYDEEVDGLFT